MSSRRLLIAAIASAALAGCNTMYTHYGDDDPGFGEAAKYDAAVQVINPTPVYSADSAQPGSNGDVGAQAVKRYRSGTVKQTQSVGTAGGSGVSMGSGPQ
jgi:hypothetical protein